MKKLINLSELKLSDLTLEKKIIGDMEFDVIYEEELESNLLKDGFNLYSLTEITKEDVVNQDLTVDSQLLIDFMTDNDFILYPDDKDNMVFVKQLPRNSKMIFTSTSSDYKAYDGQICTIIRPLNNDEFDRFACGNMYNVKFEDDLEITVFEDELSSII